MIGDDEDPRISEDHVRSASGPDGTATVVGVVHDHPASKYRVKRVVEAVDPSVLAVELPPLAVPLYEQYARGDRTPPAFGGEMSAAIQAAATDDIVGIDGPTPDFLVELVRNLYRDRASPSTARRVARDLVSAVRDATVCRAAAAVTALTSVRLEVDSPVSYESDWRDDPQRQAANERRHIDQARAVMDALEPSRAVRFRDATRETHMADRIETLCRRGDVVAVVGYGHLDAVAERLDDSA